MNEFEAIGAQFRQAREARELTLQQVEKQTRIRIKYLQAIEYGDFYTIDMPLQLRGFLRNYALAVGLDPDAIQSRFDEAVQGQQKSRRRKTPNEQPPVSLIESMPNGATGSPYPTGRRYTTEIQRLPTKRSNITRFMVTLLIVFGLVGAIGGGVYIAVNDLTNDADEPSDENIISVNVGSDTTASPPPTSAPTLIPTPNNTPVINPGEGLLMTVSAEQRLWVRVVRDNEFDAPRYEGILRPGEGFQVVATTSITIRTSNAVGLRIVINNQEYSLGNTRSEVERTFSAGGISTPTPLPGAIPTVSFTPTLTDTPLASITATRTNTPTQAFENEASPTLATFLFTATPAANGPTVIPTLDSSTSTSTPLPTAEQPTAIPTFTPSPFLPPRETRTPIVDK